MSNMLDKRKLVKFINDSLKLLIPSKSLFYEGQIDMLYIIRDHIQTGAFDIPNNHDYETRYNNNKILQAELEKQINHLREALEESKRFILQVVQACEIFEVIDYDRIISDGNKIYGKIVKTLNASVTEPSVDRVREELDSVYSLTCGQIIALVHRQRHKGNPTLKEMLCEMAREMIKEETKHD